MGDGTELDATIRLCKKQAKWLHNTIARAMYVSGMESDSPDHMEFWKLRALIGMAANLNSNETVEFTVEVRSWEA